MPKEEKQIISGSNHEKLEETFAWGKYSIVVLNQEMEWVHTVLYEHPPTEEDEDALRKELEDDEEFGLTDEDDLIFVVGNEEETTELKAEILKEIYGVH